MSDLDPNRVCKWREREGERERLVQARQGKHCIGGSTSREREMCVCVCVLFEFRQFVFLLWELVYVFQSFVSIFAKKKKSDRTRCLVVSVLEYNLGPKITGSVVHYKLEFEVGRASESVLFF